MAKAKKPAAKKKKGPADPTIVAFRGAMKQAAEQANQQVAANQNQFNRAVGDTNYIAGEVQDYVGKQNQGITDSYSGLVDRQTQAAQALQNKIKISTGAAQSDAGGELARLGIQGADAGSRLKDDGNFAALMARQQGENEVQNSQAASANAGAVGNLLLGMNQGQRQSTLGVTQNQYTDQDNQIRNTLTDFRLDQQGKIAVYKAERAQRKAREAAARKRAARYRSSYRSYGGGGGYTPYKRSSYTPYKKSSYTSYASKTASSLANNYKKPKAPKPVKKLKPSAYLGGIAALMGS